MIDTRSTIPASNYGVGRGAKIDSITFHHIVGDADAALSRFRTPNVQVSSTYVISSKGVVYYVVSEGNTPYTNGNYSENTRSITIEHAGPPYAEAMYKASIALCREIRKRHKITRFKRHRDIVATACPGTLNVERIVKESGVTSPEGDKLVLEEQPPVFNAKYYLNKNPDVNKKYSVTNAKSHWTKYGIKEGRASAPNFHVKEYLANYADLRRVYGAKGYAKAVKHYYNSGINEGRSGRTIKPVSPSAQVESIWAKVKAAFGK